MPKGVGATLPRLSRWLFTLLLRGDGAETVWGDVEKEFQQRSGPRGSSYAGRWHRRLALGSVWALWNRVDRPSSRSAFL